ncbi:MAG: FAD:protein FMN transferase, partial [Saprospiraceae bacterium]
GTQFKLILYTSTINNAQNISSQCFRRIDSLNQILSDYEISSEISQLSASAGKGQKIKISSELWTILKQSNFYAKKSDGAFDISIGPLSKLWRSMFRRSEIFNGVKINNAKAKTGFRKIKFHPFSKRVRLTQKGMRLDAGGIAKGFTVDEVVKIIRKNDITQFLVDGGGDIYVGHPPPDQLGWQIKIAIENTVGTQEEKMVSLKNTAIASSGDTYRFLEWEGKRYSHIIDPRTGYGVIDRKIVNVQANSCMKADAIASTLSVLNEQEKNQFIKKMKQVKVF